MGSTSLQPADFIGLQRQTTGVLPQRSSPDRGKNQARADVDRCMAEAKEYGVKNDTGKTVGGRAVKGATLGATISAVVAAILGGNVGRAAGAAGGATAGAVSGAFDADEPEGVFQNYVNRCLGEIGYEVIGWQ